MNLVELLANYLIPRLIEEDDSVEIQLTSFSDYARIVIADSGEGLKPDSDLFDLFPRSGVRILPTLSEIDSQLQEIVELSRLIGCKIWVQSKWQMGTVFHLEVPYSFQKGKVLPFKRNVGDSR